MEILHGDITEEIKTGYIMHQVNCLGVMGAGVALAILKKWPNVKKEYSALCSSRIPDDLLGEIQEVKVEKTLTILNSFTQYSYGNSSKTGIKYTDEQKLISNILKASKKAKKENTTLAIPSMIGCGLAGGDWSTIYNSIKDLDNLIIVDFNN